MGQTVSKEEVRLVELQSIMRDAQLRLSRFQPLAAAEEAANDPPTPHSSQAAYYAARQRLAVAVDEYRAISRRLGEALRALPPFPHALLWQAPEGHGLRTACVHVFGQAFPALAGQQVLPKGSFQSHNHLPCTPPPSPAAELCCGNPDPPPMPPPTPPFPPEGAWCCLRGTKTGVDVPACLPALPWRPACLLAIEHGAESVGNQKAS